MKKKNIFLYLIILIISSTIIYYEIDRNMGKPTFYKKFINKIVPGTTRQKIKEVLFAKKYKLQKLEFEYNKILYKSLMLEKQVNLKNKKIHDLLTNYKNFVEFKTIGDGLNLKNSNYSFDVKKIKVEDLVVGKNITKYPISTAYIEFYDGNLFIISGDGIISYENFSKFENDKKINAKIIKTNFHQVVNDDSILEHSFTGIKDFKIIDDEIYLSYSTKIKDNCRNTSILKGKMSYENIIFEKFFSPVECVIDGGSFGIKGYWNTGGRIINKDKNKIYFTHGTYGDELLAQNEDSIFGKILEIDKIEKTYDFVSIGHRNVQGLARDGNYLISSEHGPSGGDEINVNYLADKKKKNFGWPISSYGEHVGYGGDEKIRKKFYKLAPLHKSHKKHGYIEPKMTCVPSCAASQLITLPKNFLDINENNIILMGTLGGAKNGYSINFYEFSKNYEKIISENSIFLDRRVRDIIFVNEYKTIVLYLETFGEIYLLKKK